MKSIGTVFMIVMCSITVWADVSGYLYSPDIHSRRVFNIKVTNADAEVLFNAIVGESLQTPQGSLARGYRVQDDKQYLFNIYCELFKRPVVSYSCTIELPISRRSTLDISSAKLIVPNYNPFFFVPDSTGKIFDSLDEKLSIHKERNNAGVASFVIEYNEGQ